MPPCTFGGSRYGLPLTKRTSSLAWFCCGRRYRFGLLKGSRVLARFGTGTGVGVPGAATAAVALLGPPPPGAGPGVG